MISTLHIAAACRQALMQVYEKAVGQKLPNSFHHSGEGEQHLHGYYLPEDRDEDGYIDHITIHADSGIPVDVIRVLAAMRYIRYRGEKINCEPVYLGMPMHGSVFGPAHVWQMITPFVTFKHRHDKEGKERPGFAIEHQLMDELKKRKVPEAVVEWRRENWLGDHVVDASLFAIDGRNRSGLRPPPTDAIGSFAQLQFSQPVHGPLCFGYGSHFGLGLCLPIA